uniref:Uncharacterized protein n=1 Tax=Glaesserella parasuis TaxID=738 RepID=A0A7U3RZD7_GLAPU|nr:hypothetical protein [Glaesserella parasuis]
MAVGTKNTQSATLGGSWYKKYTKCRPRWQLVQKTYKVLPLATVGAKNIQSVALGDSWYKKYTKYHPRWQLVQKIHKVPPRWQLIQKTYKVSPLATVGAIFNQNKRGKL